MRYLFLALVLSSILTMPAARALADAPSSRSAAYPLSTCIVSGETLGDGDDVISKEHDGREVRFCCKKCVTKFEADPASYLKALDTAIIADQAGIYPMDTCPVSGDALDGDMGVPIDHIVGNRLVRLCCKMCKKEIKADPTAVLAKLDAAVVAAQVESYPATACPISGEDLGSMGEPFDHVFAGRLVRLCCEGCLKAFNANPIAGLATIYGETATDAEDGQEKDHEQPHDHSGHGH